MTEPERYFVIPTHRLRDVGATIREYDEHFNEPKPSVWTSDSKPLAVQNSRTAVLLEIGQDFPDVISTDEIYKAFGFLSKPTSAERKIAERVMRKLGYRADAKVGMDNRRYWRLETV